MSSIGNRNYPTGGNYEWLDRRCLCIDGKTSPKHLLFVCSPEFQPPCPKIVFSAKLYLKIKAVWDHRNPHRLGTRPLRNPSFRQKSVQRCKPCLSLRVCSAIYKSPNCGNMSRPGSLSALHKALRPRFLLSSDQYSLATMSHIGRPIYSTTHREDKSGPVRQNNKSCDSMKRFGWPSIESVMTESTAENR